MSVLSPLTNRIFLVSALLVVITMGLAVYRVNESVTAQAETDLRNGLTEAAALVEQYSRTQFADSVVKGTLIADLPVLKAATDTNDPPTVAPIAREYQGMVGADLFVVIGRTEQVLARAGRMQPDEPAIQAIVAACRQSPDGTTFWPSSTGVLHAVAIPMELGPAPLGTLVVGFSLDQDTARRFKTVTKSDIVFAAGGQAIASTLDPEATAGLMSVFGRSDVFTEWLGPEQYIGLVQPLGASAADPVALVLRSRTERLKFLRPLHIQIAVTGIVAVLIATLLGYAIARTVTRPLRALTATMREMAATGDLARPIPAQGRWDDEDAQILSGAFHQLTGSIDRFQREASQRERLSSLGRLSTVVAHEIRNPLMIIKATVRDLRNHPSPDVSEAVTSIDEEVTRLNRVVTDVLDFARPIRFEAAPADLAEICRAAAHAAEASPEAVDIAVDIVSGDRPISVVTDAERLRGVLVNVLSNAQQAVRARGAGRVAGAPVRMRVSSPAAGRWRIEIVDTGVGIAAEDLPRLFEPFFTTRRGGSGVGLALARNIIEGLGGSIAVESRVNVGTTVRIELLDGIRT